MARLNIHPSSPVERTHEGAVASRITPEQALRRSVMSCLLWESEFYEDGVTIADRIIDLAGKVPAETVKLLAVEARQTGLRHVPLLLLNALVARRAPGTDKTIAETIHRADEMAELLAMYWRSGKRPLAKQLQRGLAMAFGKFNEYQLAKYNRDGPVRLRDVLFLSHAKPADEDRAGLYRRVANNELAVPDTWEVALSAGADKKETFERLLREKKLGYLALLRNLRNMRDAGVDNKLVHDALNDVSGASMVFPFRFVAAANAAPEFRAFIESALLTKLMKAKTFSGRTAVLVDVSGSMKDPLSKRSDLTRMDAACALASFIVPSIAGGTRVFAFSERIMEIPARLGLAQIDAIKGSMPHGGTNMAEAVAFLNQTVPYDRLIVITDEQVTSTRPPDPVGKYAYMINVASAKNGVGYGKWTHIDGFSENVLRFIHEFEDMGSPSPSPSPAEGM